MPHHIPIAQIMNMSAQADDFGSQLLGIVLGRTGIEELACQFQGSQPGWSIHWADWSAFFGLGLCCTSKFANSQTINAEPSGPKPVLAPQQRLITWHLLAAHSETGRVHSRHRSFPSGRMWRSGARAGFNFKVDNVEFSFSF